MEIEVKVWQMSPDDMIEIRALRSEMNKCINQMVSLESCFSVWQKTRCQDHHDRMEAVEMKYGELELAQTKIIAKSAGVVATIVGIINVLTIIIGFMALKSHFPQ